MATCLPRLATVLAAAMWTAAPAQAQALSVAVQNVGSVAVVSIQVSPDYKRFWSGNRLGGQLEPGQQASLDLSGYGDACWFDFLITDAEGRPHTIHGVNACTTPVLAVP